MFLSFSKYIDKDNFPFYKCANRHKVFIFFLGNKSISDIQLVYFPSRFFFFFFFNSTCVVVIEKTTYLLIQDTRHLSKN